MTNSQQESEDAKLIQRAHMGDETVSKDDLLAVAKRAMERNTERKKQMTPPTEEELAIEIALGWADSLGATHCGKILAALRSAQAEIEALKKETPSKAFKAGVKQNMDDMMTEQQKLFSANSRLSIRAEKAESDNAELRARVEGNDVHAKCLEKSLSMNSDWNKERTRAAECQLASLTRKMEAAIQVVDDARIICDAKKFTKQEGGGVSFGPLIMSLSAFDAQAQNKK